MISIEIHDPIGDGLVQYCNNSNGLAIELRQPGTKPLIWFYNALFRPIMICDKTADVIAWRTSSMI